MSLRKLGWCLVGASIALALATIVLAYIAIWVSVDGNWQNTASLTGFVALVVFGCGMAALGIVESES